MATQEPTQSSTSQKRTNATYTRAYSSSFNKSTVVYRPSLQHEHVEGQNEIDPEKDVKFQLKKEVQQQEGQETYANEPTINIIQPKKTIEDSQGEQKLLKQLGEQVKSSIKRKQESTTHNHATDILALKKENDRLQAIISEYKARPSVQQSLLKEENTYLKDFISKGGNKKEQEFKKPEGKSYEGGQSIASMKKYIMAYINTAIDRNDDKIMAQQKQIAQLELRIAKLNKLQNHLTHLQFEKTVKLQQSTRKGKNITVGVIKNNGDRLDYDIEAQQQLSHVQERKVFKNPYRIELQGDSKELAEKNAQLYESLCKLQEKYQIQKENHLNELIQKEDLLSNLARLDSQNKHLKHSVFDLGERLKFSQSKQNELQSYVFNRKQRTSGKIEPNIGFSLKKELAQLKCQLKVSGADKYPNIQRQIVSIIIDRNYLRKELNDLQEFVDGKSKLSATHRQVFYLREKNHELELKCKQYEQQIEEFSILMKPKDQSKREVCLQEQQQECLKKTRLMYFCIMSSINKLQNIQAQIQLVSSV